MTDRWYYQHADKTYGPVTAAALRQQAVAGQLSPTDLIWPEGGDISRGVPAQAAIDFLATGTAPPGAPDWLNDIRSQEKAMPPKTAGTSPDWLEDVRTVEQAEQEFLTIPWDAEPEPAAVEALEEVADVEPVAEAVEAILPVAGPADTAACRLAIAGATSRGLVRDRNEDSFLVQQCSWVNVDQRHDVALVVIADGMGGHQAGDRASGIVIRTLGSVLAPLLNGALAGQLQAANAADLGETLEHGLQEANRAVLQAAKDDPASKGMGATAVAVMLWDGLALIGLVGDCRVYHHHAGRLTRVTRDQTLVARMVELGQLSPQEAANHPRRNEVTQAVGKYGRIQPARTEVKLRPGDWLVAACDGLYAHVEDAAIEKVLHQKGVAPAQLANHLVALANQGGGSDNCTVVAVRCY